MAKTHRSGFVAIIGKPNAGKSTLLNTLVGEKVAIVSNKPETTRSNIRGILTSEAAQAIFVDTPGIHRPRRLLGRLMVNKASDTILGADLLLFVIDMASGLSNEDFLIIDKLKQAEKRTIAVLNKIDIVRKSRLLPVIDRLRNEYEFDDFIPICAASAENTGILMEKILNSLPEGEDCYPKDQLTDQPVDFFVSEIIREKALQLTREEVPHSIAVVVDNISKREKKEILDISAYIYVERDSQKGIIVGGKGSLTKEIATLSRIELEKLLKSKVYLQLWVKVLRNWRKNELSLKRLGIE